MERISMSVKELERFRILNLVLQKNISKKESSRVNFSKFGVKYCK